MTEELNKENSVFFKTLEEAIKKSLEAKTDDDSCLLLVSDNKTAVTLVGGSEETLHNVLLDFMKKNPVAAHLILATALDFHLMIMQQPTLRIPPIPNDGIAEWPGKGLLFINKDENKGS